MTAEKINQVVAIYKKKLKGQGIAQQSFSHDVFPKSNLSRLAHCHGMLDQILVFVKENRMEKAFRWLGFIQGCLWSCEVYTIEELKNHNRP